MNDQTKGGQGSGQDSNKQGFGQQPTGQQGQQPTGEKGQQPTGQQGQQPTGQQGQQPTGQQPTGQQGQQPTGEKSQQPTGEQGGSEFSQSQDSDTLTEGSSGGQSATGQSQGGETGGGQSGFIGSESKDEESSYVQEGQSEDESDIEGSSLNKDSNS